LPIKTHNELDAEHKKNADMRKTVELEKEKVMDTALPLLQIDPLKD